MGSEGREAEHGQNPSLGINENETEVREVLLTRTSLGHRW